MKNILQISVLLLLIAINYSAFSKERIQFFEELKLQEKTEQEALDKKIEIMSSAEFRAYLNQRLEEGWLGRDKANALVIVDITTAPQKSNSPNASSNLSQELSDADSSTLGMQKIMQIMGGGQIASAKSQPSTQLGIESNISEPQIYSLESRSEFTSQNSISKFEQVKVNLNKSALMALSNNSDITDIQLEGANGAGTNFSAVHNNTGRFYPQPLRKQYSDQFIKDGLYQELKVSFKEQGRVEVSILLIGSEKSNKTDEDKAELAALLNEVLSSIKEDEYTVVRQKASSAIIDCTESVADQLYNDSRVRSLADYQLQASQYNATSY